MQPKQRTMVAYVVGRLINGLEQTFIYDPLQSKSVHFEGTVSPTFVKIFDNDRGCYTSGPGEDNVFGLYDYGHGSLIELQIVGNTFKGYDELAPCHFSGEVNGEDISFYDDGEGKTFSFSFKQP